AHISPHRGRLSAPRALPSGGLPIRLNELGFMFRAERSGVLSGLSRVRQISLDDTHVFCRPDQVAGEAARGLRTAINAQNILGLPIDYIRLSLRDDSDAWFGTGQKWEEGQKALRQVGARVVAEHGLDLVEVDGEAAFYGPKFDLQVRDGRGHD